MAKPNTPAAASPAESDDELNGIDFPSVDAANVSDDELEIVIAGEGETPAEPTEAEGIAAAEPAAAEEAAPVAGQTPAEPVDALDAELEETDKAYPEPIKKRIKREIRIRKRVEADFEQVKDAAIKVAQLAQDREAEATSLRNELQNLRRQHAEVLEVTFEKEIQITSSKLRKARDDGDYDAEMKAQSEIDQLRFKQNQVREARRSLGEPQAQPAAQPQGQAQPQAQPQPQGQQPAARPPAPQKAVQWVEANKSWFQNPKFAGHREFVVGVDRQLRREGYDQNTDEYYKELDRRVDEAFPTLRKAPAGAGSTSPVAPVLSGGSRSVGGKRSVTLTSADFDNMRMFGLDPTNKAHLQEYARNKEAA